MKKAEQVREYVRRRSLQERALQRSSMPGVSEWTIARAAELAFIEVLNAFDTPHKTKLNMPHEPK